ncbi:MAG: hypothetical protein KKD31_07120 [Bacteroidetes bacterium]|nr:hypothetical protein [Bacteroidota bacterium]
MEAQNNTNAAQAKRPVFLTVLCILTFIGSGLGFLGYLFLLIGVGAILGSIPGMGGGAGAMGMGLLVALTILPALSLIGAIMMMKMKKTGFYLYAAANVILLFIPYAFGMPFMANAFILPFLITAGFIVMYGVNLKHMS